MMRWAERFVRTRLVVALSATATATACKPSADGAAPPPTTPEPAAASTITTSQKASPMRFEGNAAMAEAKRAYATKACADLCVADGAACQCEAYQERGDWIFLRMRSSLESGVSWSWFVLQLTAPGYELLTKRNEDAASPRAATSIVERYELCRTTGDTDPPTGFGVMETDVFETMIPDEDFDHPMLAMYFDCKRSTPSGIEHIAYYCSTYLRDCKQVPVAGARERASWGMSEFERQQYLERRLDPDYSRGGRECDEDDHSEDCEAIRRVLEKEEGYGDDTAD